MAMIGSFSNYRFLNANVFSAMQTRLANRSSEALAEEERQDKANGLTNIAALMRANNVRVSDRIENAHDSVAVIFNDPKTDERVTLNLSKENLERLKGQFGKDNFYARSDGAIRLNGKAEAFVSGWFGDVAYQQNLAGADKDGSGRVDDEELRETKTFFVNGIYSLRHNIARDSSIETYQTIGDYATIDHETGYDDRTIEGMLNATIKIDKNFDGHIERIGELYEGGTIELIKELDGMFDKVEKNALYNISEPIVKDNAAFNQPVSNKEWKKRLEKLKEMQEELDEQFAEMAERLKEQLQENGVVDVAVENRAIESKVAGKDSALNQETQPLANKATNSAIDLEQLAPVIDEIASKVASNDVQLCEVNI